MMDKHLINVTMPACPSYKPPAKPVHVQDSLLARHSSIYLKKQGMVGDLQTHPADAAKANSSVDALMGKPSDCTNPKLCQCGQTCQYPSVFQTHAEYPNTAF